MPAKDANAAASANTDVLITGAGGFVGRALGAALHAQATSFYALTRAEGDIGKVKPAVTARCVVHLAAKTFVPESWQDPLSFYETNVLGTVNMLEYCRQHKARFVLMSSYVYGPPQQLPIPEEHPLQFYNPYSHSKLLAEEVAQSYAKLHDLDVTIVRPFNIYGPGQSDQFLIPTIVNQAMDPASTVIHVADARPKRDYLFIDDLISLLMRVLEAPGRGGIYNAGSGKSYSVAEVAEIAIRLSGRQKQLESAGQERPAEVMDVYADITRARKELGWEPAVSLEDGLARMMRQ
jgi:nucleoside-diphosphate-sugar epimerase